MSAGATRDAEVIVVGGGVMGAATAWQLAARGVEVVLLERFERGHRRGASHGASRNFNVGYEDPRHLSWLREADRLWGEIEAVSGEPLLTRTGIVNHGPGRDYAAVAAAVSAGGFATELLGAAEAGVRWPGFRFAGPVLYTPDAGRLHADRAVAAFTDVAWDAGARIRYSSAVSTGRVSDDGVRVQVRSADADETLTADRIVVTAGAWTVDVLAALGVRIPLPPLRVTQEQPAHFVPEDDDALWPGFNHSPAADDPATAWFLSGVYGMGTPGEGVKAGWHGVGPEVHPDRRTYQPDPALTAAIRRYAHEWLPGVVSQDASEITCTYTSTPDSSFFLERFGPVTIGAGFSGHGFKFAPVIGRILADLVTTP
ncbi:FAD-dependent oxidoreductase [Microbacterium sp. RD1]|uniref:FAD-dependent oxidoreductase n=1 Tax=Microbacterium sp. RD1 TaxID=3457313 RepID=UPI003FA5F7BD